VSAVEVGPTSGPSGTLPGSAPGMAAMDTRPGAGRRLSRAERIGLVLHRNLDKWLTPLGIWLVRRTKGGIANGRVARTKGAPRDVRVLLLTTRGRRSGRERTVVLQFFPDGDGMVLAAANGGGTSHPSWYFNLRSDPTARVEVGGRTIAVRAEDLPAEQSAAWWPRIVARDPAYERYARATDRPIPIVRLAPTGEPAVETASLAQEARN
jgi:F420H(2)-dependent quinone reductase